MKVGVVTNDFESIDGLTINQKTGDVYFSSSETIYKITPQGIVLNEIFLARN